MAKTQLPSSAAPFVLRLDLSSSLGSRGTQRDPPASASSTKIKGVHHQAHLSAALVQGSPPFHGSGISFLNYVVTILITCIHFCVHVCTCARVTYVQVRRGPSKVTTLLLPFGAQRLDSSPQARQQEPLSTGSSHRPRSPFSSPPHTGE